MKYKEVKSDKILHIISNLIPKLEALSKTCGAGLIHDCNMYLHTLENWKDKFENADNFDKPFKMLKWIDGVASEFFEPSQDYIDGYFLSYIGKVEKFIERAVKW